MSKWMATSSVFAITVCCLIACQSNPQTTLQTAPRAIPSDTPLVLKPLPSVAPGPVSQIKTSFCPTQPEPVMPQAYPTGLHMRQPGDPIPTPLPEPTRHPGACNYCQINWTEVEHPIWSGNDLLYFLIQKTNNRGSEYINKSQLYRIKPNQPPEALPLSYRGETLRSFKVLSDQQVLYVLYTGKVEPNLYRLSLEGSKSPEILGTDYIMGVELNQDQTELAWFAYQANYRTHLKTSKVNDFNPQNVNIPKIQEQIKQFVWMPNKEGWVYTEHSTANLPAHLIKAQLLRYDARGFRSVWLNIPAITAWEEKISNFKFSPDGKHIAIVVESNGFSQQGAGYRKGTLWLASSEGQNLRRVCGIEHVDPDFDWSPDSSKLILAGGPRLENSQTHSLDLYVVDIEQASSFRLTDSSQHPEWKHSQPRWSPDGSQIGFISNRDADFKLSLYIPNGLYQIRPDGSDLKALQLWQYSTEPLPRPSGLISF